MNTLQSLEWRYATKKFDSTRKLDANQINLLIQAANLTATSYGLQPVRLGIISDPGIKEALIPACYGQQQVAQCSHVLVLSTFIFDSANIEDYFDRVKRLRNTSDEILNPFKNQLLNSFSSKTAAEKTAWARNQAYIVLGNLLTVCAQNEIDACPMEGFVPEKVNDLLGYSSKGLDTVLLLPVGYRSADDMFAGFEKVRLPIEEFVVA